ncbi:MAG: hypothetical protein A3H96_02605 [Acidobacteria bacterium RIFCSPLOWO2_02_FULL_67_36]|nr:MAG: hypothetical protein A3H96_02605 [Acidobacteria bacterium RIFCSPLOWO2_02_FULL_67_36]OFW26122.1 MAG: hypothetical protein A3G21_23925 [Acidobacteria bacterium RIFCSPLOWO2_12_FULL_66_21]
MVPIDVRVLDRNGKPVTDLRQEDFSILEDGVPQTIRHFSTQALTAEASPEATTGTPPLTAPGPEIQAQNRRVFLLLLGRGRMEGPVKEFDAMLDFVRTRLLPQDQVALLAYNRATDFTTDHARIIAVLERFKARQTAIEAMLAHYFSGLQAVYGSKTIPPYIQKEIDAVFAVSTALRPREITPGQLTDAKRVEADQRRTSDALLRAEILAGRTGEFAGLPDPEATATAEREEVSFDQYAAAQVELNHDVTALYAGIGYLRYLEGEKHLVFVSPKGIALPRQEDDKSLAAVASDARVTLDILYTGGPAMSGFRQAFMLQDLRLITEMTGGQLTAFRTGAAAFTKLDESTRFQYLLGYYPSDARWNGKYRKVTVKVNRPGATVLYRRGYYASQQLVPLDRREFVSFLRMNAAAGYAGVVKDLDVTLQPPVVKKDPPELLVLGNLRVSGIKFRDVNGRHTASVDIGVYAGDARQRIIGEMKRVVNLDLTEETYAGIQRAGIDLTLRLPLKGKPAFVKVIVYDYGADLLGTAVMKIK